MDYEYIDREIDSFFNELFLEYNDLIESNYEFIKNNKLITPKIDYTKGVDFLFQTYKKFKDLDPKFAPKTIEKLFDDINLLIEIKLKFKEQVNSPQELFKSEFIPHSYALRCYQEATNNLQDHFNRSLSESSSEFLNSNEIADLELKKENLVKIKKIYYKEFKFEMLKQKKQIESSLNFIMNSKLFYFDRLMWKYARNSYKMFSDLEVIGLDKNFSSYEYLVKVLDIIRPDTQRYNYLKRCLKIYK
jgi:hypothetical protein